MKKLLIFVLASFLIAGNFFIGAEIGAFKGDTKLSGSSFSLEGGYINDDGVMFSITLPYVEFNDYNKTENKLGVIPGGFKIGKMLDNILIGIGIMGYDIYDSNDTKIDSSSGLMVEGIYFYDFTKHVILKGGVRFYKVNSKYIKTAKGIVLGAEYKF